MSPWAWFESVIVFLLLVPFYVLLLPTPGWPRIFGFFYLAAICSYIIFLSPHRLQTPEGIRSLREVPVMVCWSMVVIWVILPSGSIGKLVGAVLLGISVVYILFFARNFQGDSLEEWGLGSGHRHFAYLMSGEHRALAWAGLIVMNLVLLAGGWFFPDLMNDLVVGAVRKAGGSNLVQQTPPWVFAVAPFVLGNFILTCVIRYDNVFRAGRIVGMYLLTGMILGSLAGYIYIYKMNSGWVEFLPRKGFTGVGAYVLWGTLQEVLFLSYFNTRIRKGINSPLLSALLTGVVFSIYHLTAYTLMTLCFFVGIIWALIFQAEPNLAVLGLSHGISGGFSSAFKVHGMVMFKIKATVGPFHL